MTDKSIFADALLELAPTLDGDHEIEPTVVVLGDVPTYEHKVPESYADRISGTIVDEYFEHPVIQFSPRSATVTESGLLLRDGHMGGGNHDPTLPAVFEHRINQDEYVAAVIYQGEDVRVTDTGGLSV